MKTRDQLLLEQAYESTRFLKFGQDEKGPFVHHKTMDGKVLPNRFWRFYDSQGNVLDKNTPLADGQITYKQNHNTVDYYQVKKQEGFGSEQSIQLVVMFSTQELVGDCIVAL